MADPLVHDYCNPLVIQAPRIGFLNLLGSNGETLLRQDREILEATFDSVQVSAVAVPPCDVLVVYCKIQPSGDIGGRMGGLGGLVREAGAPIVIVASENDADSYIAALAPVMAPSGQVQANFILTVNRRGPLFAQFLLRLFQKMFEGKTMPEAWVELLPQVPGARHEDTPETITPGCLHVVFERISKAKDFSQEGKHSRERAPARTWPAWSMPLDLWKDKLAESEQGGAVAWL